MIVSKKEKETLHASPEYSDMNLYERLLYDSRFKELSKY
ncbi:hypothetical protein KN1_20370 [Stygiolobus caldivivus]|uniref:Uncharacterized protein n=1 Tax=Stygiolobus caldivivus TaxID=2824673 RepID=A0A8D5ZJV1_9CREN|nr:hypothetical protein KN1_20370 [Stygiolobus caldivivus]